MPSAAPCRKNSALSPPTSTRPLVLSSSTGLVGKGNRGVNQPIENRLNRGILVNARWQRPDDWSGADKHQRSDVESSWQPPSLKSKGAIPSPSGFGES